MTMGSPDASAVSGPGRAERKAIRRLSGDQASRFPDSGMRLFVGSTGATKRTPEPSGRTTASPDFAPTRPSKASQRPSGDHSGPPAGSSLDPIATDAPSATFMIQRRE